MGSCIGILLQLQNTTQELESEPQVLQKSNSEPIIIMGAPQDKSLLGCLSSVPKFPFNKRYWARVLSVYDADTIWIAFKHDGTIFKYKLRIAGIDSPELRATSILCKNWAICGRDYVRRLLLNEDGYMRDELFLVELDKYDKYGQRIVGDIYVGGDKLSELLVRQRYAVVYDGNTKITEVDWEYFISNNVSGGDSGSVDDRSLQ